MPCSSCHEAWPKLSPFGQAFKDNGYQLGNERDAPIYQHPSYWPITFRITPNWRRESTNRVAVDGATPGSNVENKITTDGFDWSGLDFHTAGTLAKNISFYVLPSSDSTGTFHFESIWGRVDNLLGSSWFNIKFGKFELDNLQSEKRILTLSNVGGSYQNYHFQPLVTPGANGNALVAEGLYKNGIGDNQANMYTFEWRHKLDKQLYWYVDSALTLNHGNAHYDLGAGGRGLTTDCHDGTNTVIVDGSSAGPTNSGCVSAFPARTASRSSTCPHHPTDHRASWPPASPISSGCR